MFLVNLNNEKRLLFLDLSIYAAKADNMLDQDEKNIINAYCTEMGLRNNDYNPKVPLDDVLKQLSAKCTNKELNMVILEIMAIIMADNDLKITEKEFVKKIEIIFKIDKIKINKACEILQKLKASYSEMNDFICLV